MKVSVPIFNSLKVPVPEPVLLGSVPVPAVIVKYRFVLL